MGDGFLRFLKQWTPSTGRFIRENGQPANIADLALRNDNANLQLAVTDGRVYQAFWRGQIPVGQTFHFAQPINQPAITGIQFGGVFQGGVIEYALRLGATFGETLETLEGYNADRTLIGTPKFTSLSPILRVNGVTGGVVLDRSFGLVPSTGAARATGTLSALGLGGVYDTDSAPAFSLTNNGNAAAEFALTWVWSESE